MSQAKALSTSLFRAAQGFLSGSICDALSINSGESWEVVQAEESTERTLELGGQQVEIALSVVGRSDDFTDRYPSTVQNYLGKTATLFHGEKETNYRVGKVALKGEFFTQVDLVGVEEAS